MRDLSCANEADGQVDGVAGSKVAQETALVIRRVFGIISSLSK